MTTSTESTPHAATIERFFAAIHDGDGPVLLDILAPDSVTRWPQSSERITGATACLRVHQNYPGGRPSYRIERISGSGDLWIAELTADYGADRWHTVSIIEFDGPRIARMTDYFGPAFEAPEWRRDMVELEGAAV